MMRSRTHSRVCAIKLRKHTFSCRTFHVKRRYAGAPKHALHKNKQNQDSVKAAFMIVTMLVAMLAAPRIEDSQTLAREQKRIEVPARKVLKTRLAQNRPPAPLFTSVVAATLSGTRHGYTWVCCGAREIPTNPMAHVLRQGSA